MTTDFCPFECGYDRSDRYGAWFYWRATEGSSTEILRIIPLDSRAHDIRAKSLFTTAEVVEAVGGRLIQKIRDEHNGNWRVEFSPGAGIMMRAELRQMDAYGLLEGIPEIKSVVSNIWPE